ncbi:MAG: TolC family protein [Bacteroidales bacterium]|nr:TolC family protein [Bacteroidales bacterium]
MRNKTGILILFITLFSIIGLQINAQEVKKFSLREAQIYALEHNYDVINALTDIEIARKKVKETTAIGLPQVSAQISYNYYLNIPTTLIPDFISPAVMNVNENIYGLKPDSGVVIPDGPQYIEAKFGVKHNATWGATLNQLIFNGQYIVGLQASRAFLSLSETSLEKSQIEIKDAIAKAYYPIIILQENKKVFDSTLTSIDKMLYETREYHNAGFLEDTDVDQLELLKSDMEVTITNINNQFLIAQNMLKYLMGIKADDIVVVTDKLEDLIAEVNREFLLDSPFNHNNHIDFIMLKNQEEIALLNIKLNKSEYLPSLNAFYSYQENAMRDEFNLFDFTKNWYPTQVIGVQMDIPIWSSGSRKYKIQQAKLELQKVKVQEEQLKQGLSLKVRTVKAEFNNAYLIYLNKQMALNNAERIYSKTEVKYSEGISTSLELSQTYNQFLTSQIDFLSSSLDLLSKKSELEKELTKVNY